MQTSTHQPGQRAGRRIAGGTVTGVVALLVFTGCAGQGAFLTDVNRVRADLTAQNTALATLAERVHGLEQRLEADARASRRLQQELQQAVEVLLKKALETEDRLSSLEATAMAVRDSEAPTPSERAQASTANSEAAQGSPHISLGMTQAEVRQILGHPVSIESAGAYIFWHYSRLQNERYVVFEQENGRVSGWRGLK